MSFIIFWRRKTARQQQLADESIKLTLTVAELRKQLEAAWENGRECGYNDRELEMRAKSVFGGIFGL